MSRSLLASSLLLLGLSLPALASDYPTKPDDMDKLCEEIGRSKDPSLPPKDRLWFMESCACHDEVGCGAPGSPRFVARMEAASRAEDALRAAEVERQAAEAKEAEARRAAALAEIRKACVPLAGCQREHPGAASACEEQEARFEYDCSAGLRDVAACGEAVKGATRSAADCQAALR